MLLHVWAAVLAFDRSCQVECLKANGHLYFLHILLNPPAATSPASASPPQPRPDDDATAVAAAAAAAWRPGLREGAGGPGAVFASGTVPASAAAAASAVIAVDRRGSSFDRGERDSGGGEGEGHETVGSKATALLVLSALCDGHRAAQAACFEAGLLPHCARAMHDDEPVMQCWAALCLAKLVQTNASIATAALALPGFASRQATLIGHRVVEVRAAASTCKERSCARSEASTPTHPPRPPPRRRRRRDRAGGRGGGGGCDRFVGGRAPAPPHVLAARCARRRLPSGTRGAPRRNLVASRAQPALFAATRLESAPPTPTVARRAAVGSASTPLLPRAPPSFLRRAGRSPLSPRPTEAAAAAAAAVAPWAPAPGLVGRTVG